MTDLPHVAALHLKMFLSSGQDLSKLVSKIKITEDNVDLTSKIFNTYSSIRLADKLPPIGNDSPPFYKPNFWNDKKY